MFFIYIAMLTHSRLECFRLLCSQTLRSQGRVAFNASGCEIRTLQIPRRETKSPHVISRFAVRAKSATKRLRLSLPTLLFWWLSWSAVTTQRAKEHHDIAPGDSHSAAGWYGCAWLAKLMHLIKWRPAGRPAAPHIASVCLNDRQWTSLIRTLQHTPRTKRVTRAGAKIHFAQQTNQVALPQKNYGIIPFSFIHSWAFIRNHHALMYQARSAFKNEQA